MSRDNNDIYLSEEQLETLMTDGSITVNGITVTYNSDDKYMTPDEDNYVLYSSTGTVTVADPVVNTDAVNLGYFLSHMPAAGKTYYRHNITLTLGPDDYIHTTLVIFFSFYSTDATAAMTVDDLSNLSKGYNIVASINSFEDYTNVKTAVINFSSPNMLSVRSESVDIGDYSGNIVIEDIVTEP